MANRAGLAAAGAVLGGVPGVQKSYSTALQTQRQEGRAQGKYDMEKQKFEMLKGMMRKDKDYIDNLYKDIEGHPQYGAYVSLMPKRDKYSSDQKGKEAATADYVKLKSMVDKSEQAKGKGIDFAPDMAKTIKEWNALLGKEMQGAARGVGVGAIGPQQKTETQRAQAFAGAAGPGIQPGFLGKTAIKEGLSPAEDARAAQAGQARGGRISKEMELRKNAALDNYKKLSQMGDAKAKEEYEKFETLDYMLKNGVIPDDENEIIASVEIMRKKIRKDQDQQIDRKLEAKMVFAKVQKDPMVKKFGQSAMKNALEKAIIGTKFKSLDELFAAQGQDNPYPEPTGEAEEEGPGIGEAVKKGAEWWKKGIGAIIGGGEKPKKPLADFEKK